MSRTETIMFLPQIVTLRGCEERMGDQRGTKLGSTMMQALQLLWLVKRHIAG